MISYQYSKKVLKKAIIKIKDENIKSINSLNRVVSSNISCGINYPQEIMLHLMVMQLIHKILKILKKAYLKNLKLLD